MTAPLLNCPRCGRSGFYAQGLKAHVCRGTRPDDARRRLTDAERATALRAAVKSAQSSS